MREIEFRIYDKELEKMTYFDDEEYDYRPPLTFRLDQVFRKDSNYNDYEDFEWNDISDRVEIMQYTGLKDKNGKKIFEGDIIDVTRPCVWERGIVIFKNGCFFIKVKETLLPLYECEINNYKLEVINNIYDNPDLLKEEI